MSHSISVRGAVKRFGAVTAVDGADLDVRQGELFTLLGPSGCGKTTLLRMVAGLCPMDGGEICFDGGRIGHLPAHRRDIGMVFQSYALFPHLTVAENVAYGLKARKVPGAELAGRVEEALDLVQLVELAHRRPGELSGGQQQRVALARAIAVRPAVLLLDEPLGSLDADLRPALRTEIRKLQRRLGITTICVTHDREEALAISDHIAVMREGRILQAGTPEELYSRPNCLFVARFVGASNLLPCTVEAAGPVRAADPGRATVELGGGYSLTVPLTAPYSGPAVLAVRPGQLRFDAEGMVGEITLAAFLGDFIQYEVALSTGQSVLLSEYGTAAARPVGERVCVCLATGQVNLYRKEDGGRLSR